MKILVKWVEPQKRFLDRFQKKIAKQNEDNAENVISYLVVSKINK